jgi:hypothetical protein
VATREYSNSSQTAIVPKQEVLPAAPPMTERHIIDHAVTAPQARGIFGLIEGMRRDYRAIVAERGLLDALRERQAEHILARYEAQLQLDLGQIVEEVRHQMALTQITNQKVEMDWAAEMSVETSKVRVALWVKFGEFLKSLGVMPDEQVDRMVSQFIVMEVGTATAHLATIGGIDGIRRSTEGG